MKCATNSVHRKRSGIIQDKAKVKSRANQQRAVPHLIFNPLHLRRNNWILVGPPMDDNGSTQKIPFYVEINPLKKQSRSDISSITYSPTHHVSQCYRLFPKCAGHICYKQFFFHSKINSDHSVLIKKSRAEQIKKITLAVQQ